MNWSMLKDNIKDVIPETFTPERLIRAISSELRRERASVLIPTVLLVGGGIIGAAVALMLAPKTGQELRAQIQDKVGKKFSRTGSQNDVGAEA